MNDEEVTTFLPRTFGIAAKTVVMPFPPRMTMHDAPAVREVLAIPEAIFDPRATRMNQEPMATATNLNPRATRMNLQPEEPILLQKLLSPAAPPEQDKREASEGHQLGQTRMARASRPAREMMALPPPAPDFGGRLQRPPQPADSPARAVTSRLAGFCSHLREPAARKILAGGGAALALILVSLLALSSSSASPAASTEPPVDEAVTQDLSSEDREAAKVAAKATTQETKATTQETPPTTETKPAAAAPAQDTEGSEQLAATTLLSGRQSEALQMYRSLAAQEDASPGVRAMAIVLSQKVEGQ